VASSTFVGAAAENLPDQNIFGSRRSGRPGCSSIRTRLKFFSKMMFLIGQDVYVFSALLHNAVLPAYDGRWLRNRHRWARLSASLAQVSLQRV